MSKTQAQTGDRVAVHYTGRFLDGQVFDTSLARNEPLEFVVGAGQMIKGFDEAVLGMMLNEQKTVTLAPEDAYGVRNEQYIISIPVSQLPADLNPQIGDELVLRLQDGNNFPVIVADLNADTITLDGNHPMAGKTLVFDIQLLEIA
ncbi:FKBP-type peptidyl-prolyl cis-trans isomerase [Rhodoflexus caldus]|jgi:peptidylprolyl isomerase|uniref:FKBP-type peptidyl-prolyl cis-trans isomerase n=1 Tax=Rhodoflexus caldus TaxID=2891236 RepID=UPI002029FD2F|nr:peptidylprolyl isomerase [Rhodoflexus caldus]